MNGQFSGREQYARQMARTGGRDPPRDTGIVHERDTSLSVKKYHLRPTRTQRYLGTLLESDTVTFRDPQDKLVSGNISCAQPVTPADCRSAPLNAMQGN